MSDVPIRPSERFDYADYALGWACRGCPRENGWVDMLDERGPECPHMVDIQRDVFGSLVLRNGVAACPRRPRPGSAPKGPGPRPSTGQMSLFGEMEEG